MLASLPPVFSAALTLLVCVFVATCLLIGSAAAGGAILLSYLRRRESVDARAALAQQRALDKEVERDLRRQAAAAEEVARHTAELTAMKKMADAAQARAAAARAAAADEAALAAAEAEARAADERVGAARWLVEDARRRAAEPADNSSEPVDSGPPQEMFAPAPKNAATAQESS